MSERRSAHQTQWAAQFAVASELCKRGYQVALTMGNHPVVDMMVVSPRGTPFSIDVKGLYKRNFWVVQPKAIRKQLFYILTFVPEDSPNRFFVLTQGDVNRIVPKHLDRVRASRIERGLSVEKIGIISGVPWAKAETFENMWKKLPK